MQHNVIGKKYLSNVINHIKISDYLLLNYNCFNILNNISKLNYKKLFKHNLYNFIADNLYNLKDNNYYILNVNKKFDLEDFTNYLAINYKYNVKDFYLDKINKIKIFSYGDNISCVIHNINLFLRLYKSKKIFKKLKKEYPKLNINILTFSYGTGFNIMYNLINKKIISSNFSFINCLKILHKDILFTYKIYSDVPLILFLNIKNKYNNLIDISNIYKIYKNKHKLKIDTFNKPSIETYIKFKLFNQNKILKSIITYINILTRRKNDIKPIGSWLLCGPSGTGKTELAKILAYSLFNSSDNLIKIDMSEYMEPHSISKLIGSPPGYSGHGQETILSKKFKYGSSFVILFDEIEKAHKNFTNLMLQVLDEGRLTLSDGKILNFNQSFIIFTSNLGYSNSSINEVDTNFVLKEIKNFFRIEFLNRINNIILFDNLTYEGCSNIFNKFIQEYYFKFNFNINIDSILKYDLIKYSYNHLYGSRPVRRYNDYLFNKLDSYNYILNYFFNYNLTYYNDINDCFIMSYPNPIIG